MLLPMAVLALWTLWIAFYMGKVRFDAIKSGQTTDLGYFKTFQGASPEPEKVQKVQRNYHNLLATPVLFYVASTAALALGITDAILLYLAWGYVALRLIHSYVHITSNVVIVRFRIFALSLLVLVAIWIRLAMLGM
jgi:hypothetical protein